MIIMIDITPDEFKETFEFFFVNVDDENCNSGCEHCDMTAESTPEDILKTQLMNVISDSFSKAVSDAVARLILSHRGKSS